uniref:Uncharacterized protein n=1 Tax=Salix viminalis TaxID=40686 RepID=A0A6N2LW24_SALVM
MVLKIIYLSYQSQNSVAIIRLAFGPFRLLLLLNAHRPTLEKFSGCRPSFVQLMDKEDHKEAAVDPP